MKIKIIKMKYLNLLVLLLMTSISYGQIETIDFESGITTDDFVDFDGGTGTVIANPQMNGINTSATVAQIVRDGGAVWSGSKLILSENLDFSTYTTLSMKVFCTGPVGTIVKFKLEGNGQAEVDASTTVSNEWETLTWDFTGQPMDFNELVFMFDFGNVGDGSATSTFLFDDVAQLFAGAQLDLPVTFEANGVNYTVTDFGGNESTLVVDPTDPANHVIQSIKTDAAAAWAGTTIGTPGGFATDIPLNLTNSKMSVRVWSPTAGTPIRLKVEDSNDPTHTCETETNTTVNGEWETIEFDFATEAPGTASLENGLNMGWTYNMASIFFNFGTDGATAGEITYFFDDVYFGGQVLSTNSNELEGLQVFPNPTTGRWTLSTEHEVMNAVQVFDGQGRLVVSLQPNDYIVHVNADNFVAGIYFAKIETVGGVGIVKLVKN